MRIILGIDPGSIVTGYGIIESDGKKYHYLGSGTIRPGKAKLAVRLERIFTEISELIMAYNPDAAAIEEVFFGNNVKSALTLGHARGAAVVAMAAQGLSIAEYSPRTIKQAVVGYGAASKQQIQDMIKFHLKLKGEIAADAADALAVAFCHANSK